MKPSFTFLLSGLFLAYIGHSLWTIYGIFFPKPCPPTGLCIKPSLAKQPQLELRIYTSLKETMKSEKNAKLLWKWNDFDPNDAIEKSFNVTVPAKTRNNGTLYVHVLLCRRDQPPFGQWSVVTSSRLTSYAVPKAETFSLMGNSEETSSSTTKVGKTHTHWRQKLTVNVMTDDIAFERMGIPGEIYRILRVSPEGDYLPLLYIDQLGFRLKDLLIVNESSTEMPLTVSYSPISVGKLRMWLHLEESMNSLHALGFTEKDTDEVKGIFADTNFYFLALTFIVAAFHLLFDFLAFKNDISYWRNRDTMVGLSGRAVLWRSISTFIIFFYLLDEETSLLVLIPTGVGTIIEFWKVTKAFKIRILWNGWKPTFQLGDTSDKEKETAAFDSEAMKYLSYLLYPLCIGGAMYSLIYVPHKSWYSWCIQSLVNGVYAFGFLFMLPQLFVNYKLKSVAHLPWRAFMYKAFNTFIDDVFAFIITMPTAHRVACFRDDLVFVIYLYQRWLYPVDKKRVNEYGQSFDEDEKKTN